ncbi:MAG: transposase [Dehalococcoidia bacterium]|nr:transposase [Dehalococcoidia bacterium]
MTRQTSLGFADEMRVGLRGMVRRVWGCRGVKVGQRLQLVYEWRYLFLVVDGRKGTLHWTWIDSMKAEMVGAAVNGLKQQTEVGAVVWDGAPSHRDRRMRGLGLPLIGLPPYSPELNPAERVFEEVRRWIEGKVYRSIEDKVEAVEAFLTEFESDPNRVRSLAGWEWIDEAVQYLPALLAA